MTEAIEIGVNDAERLRNSTNAVGVVNDPHAIYDDLRRGGDVHSGGLPTLFGEPDSAYFVGFEGAPRFTVIGYDMALTVFRNPEVFSSRLYAGTATNWGPNLLMMDGPEHTTYRALAQPAFAAATLSTWEVRWVGPILERLLTDLRNQDRADLYMAYSARFPAHTIGSAFGVSDDDVDQIHDWVIRTQTNMPAEQSAEAGARLTAYFRPIIEERRSRPADDVISLLVTSELADGGTRYRLSDSDIMGFCGLLLIAGVGTTYRSTGILLLTLLQRPELLKQVVGDRSLIPQVVEEVLRWEPPLTSFSRLVVVDTELAGVAIPAGSIVDVGVAAANRDGRRWENPHTFDPFRLLQPHLGFGRGPHFCLGNQLARMEMRVALNRLLDRFPNVRLDMQAPPAFVTGVFYRMPTSVPARLA